MQQAKADIFNLALDALSLQRRITNPETDTSVENKILNSHWKMALGAALQEMNLDSTSTQANLQLHSENPNKLWKYAYIYPNNCALFRRVQSCVRQDNKDTQIPRQIRTIGVQKVILTNEYDAIGEYISVDVPIETLSPMAALCVGLRLANLSTSLITGKGAAQLRKELLSNYQISILSAQHHDKLESEILQPDTEQSSWVTTRYS